MKDYMLPSILFLLLVSMFSCNTHHEMATNKEKANYLDWKKDKYDEPVKPDNKYDKESGFGGGKKDR